MFWFLYDNTGEIKEWAIADVKEWANLNGYSGALSTPLTDVIAQDTFANPSHYTVQNGALVKTVTDAQLLAEAQTLQQTQIQQAYGSAMLAGYISSADGTSRVYPGDSESMTELTMLRTIILSNTYPPANVDALDINGNHVPLTQPQAMQLIADAQNFFLNNRSKLLNLIQQIQMAQTIPDVQAVVWS